MKLTLFTICLISLVFPQFLTAQATAEKYKKVDYCSLFDSSNKLEGKIIRTSAFMTYSKVTRVDGGDSFFYLPKCNNGDYFSTVDFSKVYNSQKLKTVLESLEGEKNHILEIEFIGKIETSIVPNFGHLGWSRSESQIIHVAKIKDVTSELKELQMPDFQAERPLTDKGISLHGINAEILALFVKRNNYESKDSFEKYIADDFVLIDKLGRKYNKKTYLTLKDNGLFNGAEKGATISIASSAGKRKADSYIMSGFIKVEIPKKYKQTLNYENTFKYVNNSWVLLKTKFLLP